MPLYEYQCDQCGDLFEVRQKFSDEPLSTHEKCGGPAHRLISVPALQFKGTGFYITDYARGGNSAGGAGNSKKESSGSGDKGGDKKDSSSSSSSSGDKASTSGTSSGKSSDSKS